MLLSLAACATPDTARTPADSATAAPLPVVASLNRDTSNMVIHDYPATALARAPRFVLSAMSVTEIRGRDFTEDLGKVFRPLVLRDGRVAFYLDGSVLVVGQDGKEQESIGRRGEGPGEFRDGMVIRGLGDSLLVYDRVNGRLSFVVPGQGVVRMRPLSPATLRSFTGVIGQYADDALLIASEGFGISAEPDRPTITPWYSARLEPGSGTISILDSVAGPKIVWHVDGPLVVQYSNSPITVAWGSEFLISDGQQWSIERMTARGVVQARYVLRIPRRPITAAARANDTRLRVAAMRERFVRNPSNMDTTRWIAMVQNSPAADSLPLIAKALVGPDGIAWIKDGGYWYADSQWGWTALQRDGNILGRLVGKGKDPVVAFGANRVMLKSEDDDGFVTFRVHTLTVKR